MRSLIKERTLRENDWTSLKSLTNKCLADGFFSFFLKCKGNVLLRICQGQVNLNIKKY